LFPLALVLLDFPAGLLLILERLVPPLEHLAAPLASSATTTEEVARVFLATMIEVVSRAPAAKALLGVAVAVAVAVTAGLAAATPMLASLRLGAVGTTVRAGPRGDPGRAGTPTWRLSVRLDLAPGDTTSTTTGKAESLDLVGAGPRRMVVRGGTICSRLRRQRPAPRRGSYEGRSRRLQSGTRANLF